jgi:hypothetical protein
MKQIFTIITAIFISGITCIAQDDKTDIFEQMEKKYAEATKKMQDDFDRNVSEMEKEYDDYVKKMNSEFQRYLKNSFKEFQQISGSEKPNKEPKPVAQPKFEPVDTHIAHELPKTDKDESRREAEVEPEKAPTHSISPIIKEPENAKIHLQPLVIDFFGTEANLRIDRRMKGLHLIGVSPDEFAKYWDNFTTFYYQIYVESVVEFANLTNLNDWGIYKLMEKTATTLFANVNDQNLWMWAMLNQAGYRVKIGYGKSQTNLMLPILQEVYAKPYYKINGNRYYVLNNTLGKESLSTYSDDFGRATKVIDLNLPYSLNFGQNSPTVTKTTLLPGEDQPVELSINKTTIAFMDSYPQTENSVYLNAAMSKEIKEALFESIIPSIKGKSEAEAVTYLMNYLHNSFEYKTDKKQFNKEKTFFPDEIFFYPYSDCEDRTVLFTRLVNKLVELDVVAITYFNHMAAAVAFSEEIEGYSFMVDGLLYTVCDPTYLNAPIGSVMPKYEDYTPIAIKLNNSNNLDNIWQVIAKKIEKNNEGGIYLNDRTISENGKYIASGWFSDVFSINGKTYKPYGNTRDLWFASFNKSGNLEWFLPVKCSGFGYTQTMGAGKKGNVYALINYTGTINVNQNSLCTSNKPSYLILGLSTNGETIFHESISLDSEDGKKHAFYAKFKPDGTKIDLVSFPTEKVSFDSEITIDSNNDIVVRGVVGEIEGLTQKVTRFTSASTFSAEKQIDTYLNDYKGQNFGNKIAGLFAPIKLLSQNGGSISGTEVRNLLNKHNPNFSKMNPNIYESLSRMKFVINKGGIVKIQTENGKNISLDAMKIRNNSNMQIIKTSATEYKLKFIDGVKVGKAFVWFDLNFISIYGNGTLVFDYDNDHTRKQKDISDIID